MIARALGEIGNLPNATGHLRLILSEVRGHNNAGVSVSAFATAKGLAGRADVASPDWFKAGADETAYNASAELFSTGGVSGSGHFEVVDEDLWVTAWEYDSNKYQVNSGIWQCGPEARGLMVTAEGVAHFRKLAGACEGCGERRLPACR